MGTVLTSVSSHSGTRVRSTLSAPWLEVYPSPGVLLRSGVSIESQRWFLVCGDTVETAPPPSLSSVSLVDTLYSHILGELSEDPVMWMAKMTIVSHKNGTGSKYQEPITPSQHSGEVPMLPASALEAPVLDP